MTLEPRFVGLEFLANHADAVVTHHWENGLNYLFYETLWGDYPLVHNSEFLDGLGYLYASFDAEEGAAALLDAKARHDDELDHRRFRAAELFARLDPTAEATSEFHEALIWRTAS